MTVRSASVGLGMRVGGKRYKFVGCNHSSMKAFVSALWKR